MTQDIPQIEGIDIHIYADDITIVACGNTSNEIRRKLQEYLRIFEKWTEEWGLLINPQKCVVQHFTKNNRELYPILRLKGRTLVYKKDHKLLGMIFDSPKLTWKNHIEYLIRDCKKRLDVMKVLSSSVWGSTAKTLRMLYITYIRSKIDYGCLLYSMGNERMLEKLEVVQNKALRYILGARNTSPILSLQAEAHIPPLKLHRGYLLVKQYVKLKYKPRLAYTVSALGLETNQMPRNLNGTFAKESKLWLQTLSMNTIKRQEIPILPELPPWKSIANLIMLNNPARNQQEFLFYLNNHYRDYDYIYTDGSKIEKEGEKSVGAATYDSETRVSICWKLRNDHSVLAAELYAIWKTIENINFTENRNKFVLFSDSKTALQLIRNKVPKTHKEIIYKIQNKMQIINEDNNKELILHWIKGHADITGNTIADKAANHAHNNDRTELTSLSETEYISKLKCKFIKYWSDYWNSTTGMSGKGLFLKQFRKSIKYSNLIFNLKHRRSQVNINRLRIGHIGVRGYLNRFGMAEDGLCQHPPCNQEEVEEDIEHLILQCPAYSPARDIMKRKLELIQINEFNLKTLLLTEDFHSGKHGKILNILLEYLNKTERAATYF